MIFPCGVGIIQFTFGFGLRLLVRWLVVVPVFVVCLGVAGLC